MIKKLLKTLRDTLACTAAILLLCYLSGDQFADHMLTLWNYVAK